jgi:hypothetical protein
MNESLFGHETGYHKPIQYFLHYWSRPVIWWYFKFAFVRNPYDRIVSSFAYYKGGGESDHDQKNANHLLGHISDVNEFIDSFLKDNTEPFFKTHLAPQYSFLIDDKNRLRMNFIGRFENLEQNYLYISNKLKIDRPLKHINRSHKKFDSDLYLELTKSSREKVLKFYEEDFKLFNYPT